MKKVNCIIIVVIAVIAIANLTSIFSVDKNFNLKFTNVEAFASGEENGGSELRRGKCEDGLEEYVSCEWEPTLSGEKCTMADERDCSPGNTPTKPGDTTNNPACVKNGHMYYSTLCFEYCSRCSYSKSLCK